MKNIFNRVITACKRGERYMQVLLLIIFAFLCLKPMLNSGYYGDDAINSLNPACLKYENKSMLSSNYGLFLQWVKSQGRFYPMAYYGDIVYSVFTTPYAYKCSILVFVLADLVLFYILLLEFGLSGLQALVSSLLVAAMMQFRVFHDPVLQFHWMMQLVLGYFLISMLLFVKGLRTGRNLLILLSVFFYLFSMLTYEITYLFFPFYFLAGYYVTADKKKALKSSLPFFIAACVLITVALILRSSAYGIDQRYLANGNAPAYFRTLGRQLLSAIPLSYYSIDPNSIFIHKPLQLLKCVKHSDWLLILILASSLMVYLSARQEKTRLFITAVFGTMLFVLPALLIAVSIKIQKDIGPGFGYIPVYLQQFGFALMLLSLLEAAKRSLNRNVVFAGIVSLGLAIILSINLQSNRTVIEVFNTGMKYPREVLGKYLKENAAADLAGIENIILLGGGAVWENKYFFYQQTGNKYSIVAGNEFEALPSGTRLGRAVVIKYWYCGGGKGIVELYGISRGNAGNAVMKLIKQIEISI